MNYVAPVPTSLTLSASLLVAAVVLMCWPLIVRAERAVRRWWVVRRLRRTIAKSQAAYFKRQERAQAEAIRARARVSRRVS